MNKEIALALIESHRSIQPDGCWIWTGGKTSAGYGEVGYKGATYYVHRLSAFIYHDMELDSPFHVLHLISCNNPSCFNPEHIYLGTNLDNAGDRNILITHCKFGHKFSPENTYIHMRNGRPRRQCRQCKADRQRERYRTLYGVLPSKFKKV